MGDLFLGSWCLTSFESRKNLFFVDCEDARNACFSWIQAPNPNILHGPYFSEWVTTLEHLLLEYPIPIQLSVRQATVWLQKRRFEYHPHRQNDNVDGHERHDVV